MPTVLKLSDANADPAKWSTDFKKQLAEAGDTRFFTQQIFTKHWNQGFKAVFLPPMGAKLELTLDTAAKKFSWLITPKDQKGKDYVEKNPTLKAALKHTGVISGLPTPNPAPNEKPAAVNDTKAKEEEARKKLEALYQPLFKKLDGEMAGADVDGKQLLQKMRTKVQAELDRKNGSVTAISAEVDKIVAFLRLPSHQRLEQNRAKAEDKFRQNQKEAQKAAEKRKEANNPAPADDDEETNRWRPSAANLPGGVAGQLTQAQRGDVQRLLDNYNDRGGRGGNAHRGVGNVLTMDLTGPRWGGATGRGDWRLQIDGGAQQLNIVNHQGRTYPG